MQPSWVQTPLSAVNVVAPVRASRKLWWIPPRSISARAAPHSSASGEPAPIGTTSVPRSSAAGTRGSGTTTFDVGGGTGGPSGGPPLGGGWTSVVGVAWATVVDGDVGA